ncbi:MAG: arylsulfatase [Planctomycetales bacterium]|nr:arylsulfatase [Planctomycetales bacterium]
MTVFARHGVAAERPNVVIVITDDQGWGDLSLHGNENLRTPNIDGLAQAGAQFERFFVSPVCSPTRASLLTGRYHLRCGVTGVTRGGERMNLDEVTIAELFRSAGYATAAFGKWHNGSQYPYHPNGRGFDEFYGFCCGHWGSYFDPLLDHNGEEVQGSGFCIDDFTDHAMQFIEANRDQPFLCYVAYNTPHSPMLVPDEFYDRALQRGVTMRHRDPEKEDPLMTIAAMAMCENIDWNMGRLLKKLDELKLAEDTIIVYLSDNGPNSWRWNGEMKGRKGSVDEGGVRSPLFVRWPKRISPGRMVEPIASHIDLLPTLVDLCDIDVSNSPRQPKPMDGVSLKPLLLGEDVNWPDRAIFSTWGNKYSIRTQRYRADAATLFDMQSDPAQRENLAQRQPDLHRALLARLNDWRKEMAADKPGDRAYPVGHPARGFTVLPAQDSEFQGKGLRFSAGPPNASWLTGWTAADAHVDWDIEVLTAGDYTVTVKYACADEAVGTKLAVTRGSRSVSAEIKEAFDPPLFPAPDRVKRIESYDKPFQRLSLGRLRLEAGRAPLVLTTPKLNGELGIEIRQVELRRVEP